ncbi:LCP family protein [Pallidibacillus pasinlerensis]|uniref:LCP family protein n=1 Tax=Pallidibacillus pasinlerensis TaxID=2703818 RepID=UPI0028AF65BC|nr:LCP family protein [Pallidibacillus pasinlerensis]
MEKKELINILLLGVDERDNDGGRSDSIMIASLNPEDEQTTVVSIPRDTLAEIAGKGFETKINHAYAYGGADMSVATVEKFLDLDLDYYVEINMEGLADLIDAIGGITVNNEIEWIDEGYYKKGYRWEKGEIELDGEKALGYVRMRHLDPNSDFGRAERQRKVINAIIDKGKNMATVLKLNSVIDVLGDNLQTNMTFDDMKKLLLDYNHLAKKFPRLYVTR